MGLRLGLGLFLVRVRGSGISMKVLTKMEVLGLVCVGWGLLTEIGENEASSRLRWAQSSADYSGAS